jgi:hypothetical protein
MVRGDVYGPRRRWALGRKALIMDLIWLAASARRTEGLGRVDGSIPNRADIRTGSI